MKNNAVKTKTTHASPASFRRSSGPFFQKNSPGTAVHVAVAHGIQAQPWFNKAQDPFEKEADAVADQVVAGRSAAPINGQGQSSGGELIHLVTPLTIARKKEKREEEPVQTQVEEEEAPLQARADRGDKEKEQETVKAKAAGKAAIQTRSESDMKSEKKKEEKQDPLQRQAEEEEETLQTQPEEEEFQKQAEEEEEALQAKAEDEEEIQKKAEKDEEEPIQRRAAGPLPRFEPGSLQSRLSASKGRGSPLPDAARTRMEKSFAADFSGIRIHTDDSAVALSRRVRAQAFTHGRDIYFNRDKFSPDSRQGEHLLAHELTHTVQQGKAFPKPIAKVQTAAEKEPEEELDGQSAADTASAVSPPPRIQRSFMDSVAGAAGALWDATAGQLVDAAGQVISMTSEMFWSLLETAAPALVPIVREISAKGILGFLKEKISQALNHIFDGLQNGSALLGPLFSMYVEMVAQAGEIVLALASGDCKPLFAAVNRLKDMLSKMAGDAWNAVTGFFAPVGAFFSNLWQSFGAPVLDWLKQTAVDVWNYISGLGQQIWAWTQPVRDAVGGAWSWVKDKLGLGGEGDGDSEGGLMKWVQGKAEEAWGAVKEELQPVIAPIQAVVEKVQAILPLEAIFNLRETVQGWLSKAEAMGQAMGDDGGNVAAEQTSLRDEILPAILAFIESLRLRIIDTGLWISDKIGAVVATVSGFIDSLMSSPLVSGLQAAVMWIKTALLQLTDWYRSSVVAVFNLVGDGLVKLSTFIRPILDILNQIVETLKNLMGKLPDLILGPVWWLLPDCIKNPIKDFILNQILMRIPFFQQFISLGDIWAKVKDTALTILKQIFVDGNLFGALWTYFKAVLGLFGLPPQLITNIIVKAAQALGDIIANPIGFIINILKAVKEGFVRFFSNILKHLFGGVTDWLFGQIAEAGITIPKDFSLRSILDLVFQILGLTMEKIWKKLADKIGQDKVDKLKEGIKLATGAWEWIKIAATEGPSAIWEKLKEKLSDLWTAVITGVVGWINSVIIVQGTKWLLSLLDVSGIMPTITATIALYKAIESFFAYLKQMLEIVNTVMNGIADMAKGAIGTAAGFLESALAKSVPIIIGFLANQFGLGRLGHRLREIIGAIHQKVDGAIDWLIEKAIDMGKAFLNALKTGVESLKKTLGLGEKDKKGEGEEEGDGRDGAITLATLDEPPVTLPRTKEEEIEDLEAAHKVLKLAEAKVEDTVELAEYFKPIQQRFQLKRIEFQLSDGAAIGIRMEINPGLVDTPVLNARTETGREVEGQNLPARTNITFDPTTLAGHEVGKCMVANPVGPDHEQGSIPQQSTQAELMAHLPTGSGGKENKYVKGHLLIDAIGGKAEPYNLFPITDRANKDLEEGPERVVKGWVKAGYYIYNKVEIMVEDFRIGQVQGQDNQNRGNNFVRATIRSESALWQSNTQHQQPRLTTVRSYPHLEGDINRSTLDVRADVDRGNAVSTSAITSIEARGKDMTYGSWKKRIIDSRSRIKKIGEDIPRSLGMLDTLVNRSSQVESNAEYLLRINEFLDIVDGERVQIDAAETNADKYYGELIDGDLNLAKVKSIETDIALESAESAMNRIDRAVADAQNFAAGFPGIAEILIQDRADRVRQALTEADQKFLLARQRSLPVTSGFEWVKNSILAWRDSYGGWINALGSVIREVYNEPGLTGSLGYQWVDQVRRELFQRGTTNLEDNQERGLDIGIGRIEQGWIHAKSANKELLDASREISKLGKIQGTPEERAIKVQQAEDIAKEAEDAKKMLIAAETATEIGAREIESATERETTE